MQIIVGLGNPGTKYRNTRHNIGFMFVDFLANNLESTFSYDKKFNSDVCKTSDYLFVKPQTFMNDSGSSISKILSYFDYDPKDVLVVHDDIAFEIGEYKVSFGSGAGEHNGVIDIIEKLGTKDFYRLRFGIGHPRGEMLLEDFVLTKFTQIQLDCLASLRKSMKLSTLISG